MTIPGGIPITDPHRTLHDLARTLKGRPLEQAVNRAERLVDFGRLRRSAPASLQAVLSRYSTHATRSELEERFLELCDDHGIPRPETNARIEGYEVDFVWRDRKLIVEVDGYEHHPRRERSRATANGTSSSRRGDGTCCGSRTSRSPAGRRGSPPRW